MLSFEPHDPFPLIEKGSTPYAEERRHAEAADRWLGLRIDAVEASLDRSSTPGGSEHWIGLHSQSLQTPYTEIRRILHEIAPRAPDKIVDLGAGYGRMGFVIGKHYLDCEFIGYEIVEPRVTEGCRCLKPWGYAKVQLLLADLSSAEFRMPEADHYFLYDFGSRQAIAKSLQDLRQIALRRPITVVGRGRASRDAIEREHPWLSQVIQPRHCGNFSIYSSGPRPS